MEESTTLEGGGFGAAVFAAGAAVRPGEARALEGDVIAVVLNGEPGDGVKDSARLGALWWGAVLAAELVAASGL